MLKRIAVFLVGLLAGLLAAALILLLSSEPRGQPVRLLPPPTPGPITVHVSGAVRRPGVVELPRGSIVLDAVEAAGGAAAHANLEALNLAQPLEDGQKVYLPPIQAGAKAAPASGTPQAASALGGKIHVNTASAAELESLPGIGPSLARSILEYREAHGPFAKLEDLLNVPGIGPAKLEQLRPWVILP